MSSNPVRSYSGRRWRPRTPIALAAALTLATTIALAATPGAASAQQSAACPTNGIPFTSQLTNGNVKIGRMDPATGVSAAACGVVDFTPDLKLLATVPKENLTFEPFEVPIGITGLLSIPVQITAVSDFTGPVTFAADGIHIALSGQVVADVRVLLSTCRLGPFTTSLTTDTSGALTGAPFFGTNPADLAGRLVGNDDAVPGAGHNLRCPLLISALLNSIAGLPAAAGQSSITFDATLQLSPTAAAALRE